MGTSGPRVVDASIIPDTPSTVLNLTVMMLAERIYQRVYQAWADRDRHGIHSRHRSAITLAANPAGILGVRAADVEGGATTG